MQLEFPFRWVNAPGFLGFAPEGHTRERWSALDAFATNPISYRRRRAADKRGATPVGSDALIHSGYPNPGFSRALGLYGPKWERAELPIILSLMAAEPGRLRKMVTRAEGIANVQAIQILLAEDFSRELMRELCRAARGELPLIAQLPLERCAEEAAGLLEAGAAAIAMGPARGEIEGEDGERIRGRWVGPGQFEQALALAEELGAQGLPFIGGGGVFGPAQAGQMRAAGAMAVALDAVLWRAGGWEG